MRRVEQLYRVRNEGPLSTTSWNHVQIKLVVPDWYENSLSSAPVLDLPSRDSIAVFESPVGVPRIKAEPLTLPIALEGPQTADVPEGVVSVWGDLLHLQAPATRIACGIHAGAHSPGIAPRRTLPATLEFALPRTRTSMSKKPVAKTKHRKYLF